MKDVLLTLVAFSLSFAAHAGKIEISESDNRVTVPGVISLSAEWVKDKGKKYDVHFKMRNEHDKPIIVLFREMQCWRGSLIGELKHTFFNTGEKTIDLHRAEMKEMNLVCRLSEEAKGGEYRLVVGSVYENASGDGHSLGKVLKHNITWQVMIAE